MKRLAAVALTWGCAEPVPLPAPRLPASQPTGLMVRAPGMEGFVARPREGERHPAVLVWVDRIDDASRERALDIARTGEVALLVEPGTDPDRARTYLAGNEGVVSVRELCLRELCP